MHEYITIKDLKKKAKKERKNNNNLKNHSESLNAISVGYNFKNWEELLEKGIKLRTPLNCISAAWQYFMSITQKQSSANLIQAQRDYFGAHGFLRTDSNDKTVQHGPWARKKN